MRARTTTVALAVLTLLASCQSLGEGWTFSLTRALLSHLEAGQVAEARIPNSRGRDWGYDYDTTSYELLHGAEGLAVLLGVVIVLPLAIDTVLLPITYTHDLMAE